MKWIECKDCGEEFRVICESLVDISYCPFCGADIDEDYDDEYEDDDYEEDD